MATGKDSGSGVVHECFYHCGSKKHASNLIATVIKSTLSDEKVAAYLKWACVKYPYAVDSCGRSMVHAAAMKGRLQLLRFLLTHRDVNINSKDLESAYSPLHYSLYFGQIHCAVRLIQAGANLQQTDYDNLTPLDHVIKDRSSIVTYDNNQPCEVYIWGMNTNYTLGIGHNHSKANPDLLDYFRKENVTIKKALISKFHSLFLGSNGRVWTCGLGSGGRLGLGDEATALVPKPVKIGSSSSESCISASIGNDHSVLLMENGSVWSFGLNNYHQLGQSPLLEKLLYPKVIKALKGMDIIGISASKFHTVFWTQNQVLTCGLHGGQLGHNKENQNTVPIPKVVQKLDLKSSTIRHVATSDGATVVVSSKGDIFLFHEYQCKKLTPKHSTISPQRICVIGGHLDHKVYSSCLREKGGDELKIVILSGLNHIYLWEETCPQMTRCLISPHRYMLFTDMALNRASLMLTTRNGEAFQGEIKVKKVKAVSEDDKPPSPKPNPAKSESEDVYNYIKLKRIPHIYRAVSVACDLKGRNFAVVQVCPNSGLLEVPSVETSEMRQNMKSLLAAADEFDTLHDVVFEVGGNRFPAHRYVVSHSSPVLEGLIDKSEVVDGVSHVEIDNVRPEIFQRILSYLYTGECDLLKTGICPLSLDGVTSDAKEPMKESPSSKGDPVNQEEISAFEYYKQQKSSKKKNESKGKDPLRNLRDAARLFELTSLSKVLECLRYENGYICKSVEGNVPRLPPPTFSRKTLQNLWNISFESENGEIIKAHKCILVARLEFFNCMINNGWLESSLKTPLKLPMPGNVLEILIRFLYTDEAPEIMNCEDPDLASWVLVISDQYFCTRLKEIAEAALGSMITLKNAVEMLQLSVTYSASQLKRCAMEFICLNLPAVLESQALDILDDSLLTDLRDFYRSWSPCIRSRLVQTSVDLQNDEFIESIYNAQPVSLDKVEEEAAAKPNSKTPKKKREKKTSESKNQRMRNTSVGSVTSDEELLSSLDYSDLNSSDHDGSKESTWIMVTSHSNKQQRMSQAKPKVTTPPVSKPSIASTPKSPSTPLIPIQKPISVPSAEARLKKESCSDFDRDCLFLSTSSEKEFPALSASAPERISTVISPKSPSESSKKFVKLSQKQRKKIAFQSKSEEEESAKKSPETVKSVWGIPKYESQSLSDIMKDEIKSNSQQSVSASSPPWQGPSSSSCSLSAIMAAERQQRDFLSKIKSKPLEYTQMEDKAMDDLMLLYDVRNVTDERITVRRADPVLYSPPVWVSSHR